MTEEFIEEEQKKKGFFDWLKSIFHKKDQDTEEVENVPKYKRKMLDGRIEKYLDQNLNGYIQEYGILTGLDIESYEIRYTQMTSRVHSMKEYMIESDAQISLMENEIVEIQKASRKK